MSDRETELPERLFPFNVEPEVYHKMWDSPAPDQFTVVMRYVRMPNCHHHCAQAKYDEVRDRFAELASRVADWAAKYGIKAKISVDFGLDLDTSCKWLWNDQRILYMGGTGLYPQVGFRLDHAPESNSAVMISMNVLDFCVAQTRTYRPDGHPPLDLSQKYAGLVADFRSIVGDTFSAGKGIWSDALCDFRLEIQVKMASLLVGEDPDELYSDMVKQAREDSGESE